MKLQLEFYGLPISTLKVKIQEMPTKSKYYNAIFFTIKTLELHFSSPLVLSTATVHQYVYGT